MSSKKIPKLIFDSHEQDIEIIKRIEEIEIEYKGEVIPMFPNFETRELVKYDPLKDEWVQVGDVTNEYESFILEHKTIYKKNAITGELKWGDWHTSLTSKRLADQMSKLHMFYDSNRYILTLGHVINYISEYPRLRNLCMATIGMMGRMGISFIQCYDIDEYLEMIFWINNRSSDAPMTRQDIESSEPQSAFTSIKKIPQIGKRKAEILFENLRNVDGIIDWSRNPDKQKIKFIGDKSIEAIEKWRTQEFLDPRPIKEKK